VTPTYLLRHMRLEDIPQVVKIDEASFPSSWSPRTYQFEISNRDTSQMIVLEISNTALHPVGGWRSVVQRLLNPKNPDAIIGYGGCWLIAGEAHISTIAVHPDFRGLGLGELLLVGMLQRGIYLGGDYSVLEVRASNYTAQALYRKYEYQVVGRRKAYYRDNSEDALLMEIRPLDAAYQQRLAKRAAALQERLSYTDHFTRHNKA
jgi:[ribosomal protein S18]-alanine N-acetyltransferase